MVDDEWWMVNGEWLALLALACRRQCVAEVWMVKHKCLFLEWEGSKI